MSGNTLRNPDKHQLQRFDMLAKNSKVGEDWQVKNEMRPRTQRWSWFCSRLRLYKWHEIN